MSGGQPTRPQRHVAGQRYQPLHSAGLLVEVVRTLTTSPSQAQKELVKEKLEKDYAATKEAVDCLVDAQHQDVSSALQSFRRVSTDVQTARERIKMIKNNLSSCQLLLRCKRDELKKLWLESAELKHVARLLEQLDTVKGSQQQIVKCMDEGLYLHAAETLTASDALLDGGLKDIDGLRDLRQTFSQLKKGLFDAILVEIYKQLYVKPSSEVLNDTRRSTLNRKTASDDDILLEAAPMAHTPGGAEYASLMDELPAIGDNGCALEDCELSVNPVQRLAVLSDALGLLGAIDAGCRQLVDEMEDRLWSVVVYRTSRFICDHLHGSSGISGEARSLAELLRLLFVQLRFITAVFGVLVRQFRRTLELRKQDIHSEFNMQTVWDRVQLTVERLLSMYLDVKSEQEEQDGKASRESDSGQISIYFTKKAQIPARRRLFAFNATAFSQAYESERKLPTQVAVGAVERGQVTCVCRPGAQNIKAAFRLVMRFVSEIEGRGVTAPCRLRTFLNSYIRKSFLPTLREDLVHKARSFLVGRNDAWTRTTSATSAEDQAAVLNLRLDLPDSSVPLLFSTLKTLDCCRDVEMVLSTAPSFCREFFQLWLQIVKFYLEAANAQYLNLSCSTPSSSTFSSPRASGRLQQQELRRRKISAAWAMDNDISRLLKSLPNWQSLSLAAETPVGTPSQMVDSPQGGGGSAGSPQMESADEVRSRNARESEILIGNLGSQTRIEENELILFDSRRFQLLASFQESVEYFWRSSRSTLANLPMQVRSKLKINASSVLEEEDSNVIMNIVNCRPMVNGGVDVLSPMDEFVDCLNKIEQLSSTCLLMLHLEVRVHCFYHLLPLVRQPMFFGSSEEVDEQVVRLNKDLIQLSDLLSGTLQAPKLRYIFEGLGHLISTIFIAGCQHIMRMSDTGKKRICRDIFSVQQCLSGLTSSREPDLDQARRFYELLYKSPDDILNTIVEGGAEYSIGDYTNLLALAVRSHPILSCEPGALEMRLRRLKSVLLEKLLPVNG